jgi:diphthamide biosynthesis methyltransferase
MNDPRQSEVWGKKPEVADRTVNERKYCKPCDYYYSEMYTCPICYGDDRATERIIKLLDARVTNLRKCLGDDCDCIKDARIIDYAIELIKGETHE